MKKLKFILMLTALAGMVFFSSCSDDEPAPADGTESVSGSTWQLNGELMPTQGIENLRVTFDADLKATDVSFSLEGDSQSFSGGDVSGTAIVNGLDVEFDIEFGPHEAGFDGTLEDDKNSGTGLVTHRIIKDLGGTVLPLVGGDPDGTITKQ